MSKQRISFPSSLVCILGFICMVSRTRGDTMHKIKCLDKEIELKDVCKGRMECSAEFLTPEEIKTFKDPAVPKDKKKEIMMKAHDNMCIMACQLKKHLKVLNEDGTLNKAELDKLVDSLFPEGAREGLKTGFVKCHEESMKNLKDDKQCESYKPFRECLQKEFTTACKIDPKQFFLDAMKD